MAVRTHRAWTSCTFDALPQFEERSVLFRSRQIRDIAEGRVTVNFRHWRRAQAKVGGRYQLGTGLIEVDRVEVVRPDVVSDTDLVRAGIARADLERLVDRGEPGARLYRIEFRYNPVDDRPRPPALETELTAEDVQALRTRLARMDAASSAGPWTAATLHTIGERPATRAADLAASLGRDTPSFKSDVRRLKALGLTESLEVGYRISPRGRAFLDRLGATAEGLRRA